MNTEAIMLVLVLAIASCAPAHTPATCETCAQSPAEIAIEICIDVAFAPAEARAASDACAAWTAATCGLVRFEPRTIDGGTPAPASCAVTVLRPGTSITWALAPGELGAVSLLAPRVAYVIQGVESATIYAHEIGHALGVSHGAALMRARNPSDCIDRRAAIAAALGAKGREHE